MERQESILSRLKICSCGAIRDQKISFGLMRKSHDPFFSETGFFPKIAALAAGMMDRSATEMPDFRG